MKRLVILLTLCSGLAASSLQAQTQNEQFYGKCGVATQRDLLTDEESHMLVCLGTSSETYLAIVKKKDHLAVALSTGPQFHLAERIPVAIRVDRSQVIRRHARWNFQKDIAHVIELELPQVLLTLLPAGRRAVIQVGDEQATIDLHGSARAVRDFRQRLRTHQQALEIPAQKKVLSDTPEIPTQKKVLSDTPEIPTRVKANIAEAQKLCREPQQTWWNTKISKTYSSAYERYLFCLNKAEHDAIQGWKMLAEREAGLEEFRERQKRGNK